MIRLSHAQLEILSQVRFGILSKKFCKRLRRLKFMPVVNRPDLLVLSEISILIQRAEALGISSERSLFSFVCVCFTLGLELCESDEGIRLILDESLDSERLIVELLDLKAAGELKDESE